MTTRTMMPILVICEGESDEEFIHQLVNEDKRLKGIGVWSLLLPPHIDDANRDSAGVGGYTKRLQGLLTETGLETCKLIVVMADNDDDPAKKLAEVKKAIKKSRLFGIPDKPRDIAQPVSIPRGRHVPDIAILMIPWDDECGGLETMCFAAGRVKNKKIARCIDSFTKCVNINKWPSTKLAKVQVRFMLAVLCQKNTDISFKWSFVAREDLKEVPWPVTHKAFEGVAQFFCDLSKSIKAS